MPKSFGASERRICGLFLPGARFYYGGTEWVVVLSGKPTCHHGEPKTDIYIAARSPSGQVREFKLSFKQENADFLENKMTAERAALLFGRNWQRIISNATTNLYHAFASRPLIYKSGYRKVEAGSITLGWKFELLNVDSGRLSGNMLLSRSQVIDVYAGTHLPGDKRHATVSGYVIPDSGIANCILVEDHFFRSPQDVVDSLISVEEYVAEHPQVYFACKALNYRTFRGKYDGDRPLAVYVDWWAEGGRLCSALRFDTPLMQGGDDAFEGLHRAMRQLRVRTTDELNAGNVADPGTIWE